jgi:hypothetical protein
MYQISNQYLIERQKKVWTTKSLNKKYKIKDHNCQKLFDQNEIQT